MYSNYTDFDLTDDGYLDSKQFKAFELRVLSVIAASMFPLCTREIKAALGPDCKEIRWLQDALDRLKMASIEAIGILPTRYAIRTQMAVRPVNLTWNETSARLFPTRTRLTGEREAV